MPPHQRKFFFVLGLFQTIFLVVMLGWMLIDAYNTLSNAAQQPLSQFLLQPILWHKVGELFLAIPIGIAIAAFYMFWQPAFRVRFLQITTPLLVFGGALTNALLFGLVHAYQGWAGAATSVLFGLVLSAVYCWGGRNLWACILFHGVFDTPGLIFIYLGLHL